MPSCFEVRLWLLAPTTAPQLNTSSSLFITYYHPRQKLDQFFTLYCSLSNLVVILSSRLHSVEPPSTTRRTTPTMNWTGGRLQRHSTGSRGNTNSNRSLRAVQKQHFAKKRQTARNGRGASMSPIKLLGVNTAVERREKGDGSVHERKRARLGERSRFFEGGNGDAGGEQDKEGDIESIRRNLLRRNDWANLSLSRPLRMAFSSSRVERDNLAKRRRLTDDDRLRLTTAHYEGEGYARQITGFKRRSSSVLDPDTISIHIGRPAMRQAISATPASQPRTVHMLSQATSNDTMLFDGEERYRRTQSILVERSDTIPDLNEEDISWPMSQEMIIPCSQPYELEDEQVGEREELIMSTSENSVPLPVLDPRGFFRKTEDGQISYNPPVEESTADQTAFCKYQAGPPEVLLTSSSPMKLGSRRTHVPLWMSDVPEDPQKDCKMWHYTADNSQYPWTSGINKQPAHERTIVRGKRLPQVPVLHEYMQRYTDNPGKQRSLKIDQHGRVSVASSERQRQGSIPFPGNPQDTTKQRTLRIQKEYYISTDTRIECQSQRNNLISPIQDPTTTHDPETKGAEPASRGRVDRSTAEDMGLLSSNNRQTVTSGDIEGRKSSVFGHAVELCEVDGDAAWRNFVFGG